MILSLGGENESLAILGERSDQGWRFRLKRNESALVDRSDEADRDLSEKFIPPSRCHAHLRDVLNSLSPAYRMLRPTAANPIFAYPIWSWLMSVSKEVRCSNWDSWEKLLKQDNPIYRAASLIKDARKMALISGAGLSVDSGVKDFRSASGWWRNIDPRTVATVEALESNYDLFHEFYSMRITRLKDIVPHQGHFILSEWEKRRMLACVATQNVDGLHQAAGNQTVYELHGTIRQFRCHACGAPHTESAFLRKQKCACGGKLRPNVVLFGESLPSVAWHRSLNAIKEADLVLVIGTSLQVAPVNQLPFLTRGHLIFINAEETGYEDQFDIFIKGRAVDCLVAIEEWLNFFVGSAAYPK